MKASDVVKKKIKKQQIDLWIGKVEITQVKLVVPWRESKNRGEIFLKIG